MVSSHQLRARKAGNKFINIPSKILTNKCIGITFKGMHSSQKFCQIDVFSLIIM